MPQTRKRKLDSSDILPTPKHRKSNAPQQGIEQFGRIGKSQQVDVSAEKRKTAPAPALEHVKDNGSSQSLRSTKRLLTHAATADPVQPGTNLSRKRRHEHDNSTPEGKRFKDEYPISPASTPTKGALKLGKLNLTAANLLSTPQKDKTAYSTPPLTPQHLDHLEDVPRLEDLPNALQDVLRLFSSFLTALSLYYAHHGIGSPLDVQTLLPLVAKSWKKRRVFVEDIRRLLGVLGNDKSGLILLDKGEGRICLDKADTRSAHINQHDLVARFGHSLRKLWDDWKAQHRGQSYTSVTFLDQLPMADIVADEEAPSATRAQKGKAVLEQIKTDSLQARASEAAAKKPTTAPESRAALAVSSRGTSLLDRIVAKQQLLSSLPSAPTQEQVARRAALDRIDEVVLVLDLLAAGRPRVSFSAQTMVQHLQSSLRHPISKDEAERCIQLMAKEVAPGFVSLINSGSVRGIVVTKAGRPTKSDLLQRLQSAGAGQG